MKYPPIICASVLGFTPLSAQEVGDVEAGIGLSTFGANLEVAYTIQPDLRVRGALMGGLSYSDTEVDGTETSEIDAQLGAFAVLADYYPTQSGWRVSGGLLLSNSDINTVVSGDIEVNDQVFTDESLEVSAEFSNSVAPIITTGYDLRFGDGWSFNSEVGIVLIGGIDLDATSSNAIVQDEIDDDEDFQDAVDDAADINILPYVGLSVSYKF